MNWVSCVDSCNMQRVEGGMKDLTCIAWHTEQCPYGDENGVCQHHTNMDQDVEHCKRHERD